MPKNKNKKTFDLVTLGETMIRHFTRDLHRLEQCIDLGFSTAGSESNVAIAASRLGLRCGWISKLVDNPLGRKIEREIRVHGVDVSQVVWTNRGRVGSFYIEFGSPPRPTHVIYDRKGSAASTLRPSEVDWRVVGSARWFHSTGITCALSASCLEAVRRGIFEAHQGSALASLELNYRGKLWTPARCRKTVSQLLPDLDLFIATSEDIKRVFGFSGSGSDQAARIQSEFGPAKVLLTCGSHGAICLDLDTGLHELSFERFPIQVVDRIGAGDAFTAGFFTGLLEDGIDTGLLYGAAACALKYAISGDLALISREEMLEVAHGRGNSLRR
jgi:2-dehydro-3-deoxygluconokinase